MAIQLTHGIRHRLCSAIWNILGHRAPEKALPLADWLENEGGQATIRRIRPSYSIPIAKRPVAGNVDAVFAACAKLPADQRGHFTDAPYGASRVDYAEQQVVVIPQGRFATHFGMILTPDNRQLSDISGGAINNLFQHQANYRGLLPPLRRVRGSVAMLMGASSHNNYFHWTAEVLPRIRQMEEAGVTPDYYCLPRCCAFHRESLEILGIPRSKQLRMGIYAHVQADELIVPTLTHNAVSPENANFLYRRAANAPWSTTQKKPRLRLYIARRGRRRVINERELFASLRKLDFTRHYLEDYGLRQQIELFQQAEIVIGPHGAGLVNLVYSNPGTKVIELATPVRPWLMFYYLAHNHGLNYLAYFGEAVNCRHTDSDLRVDVSDFIPHVHHQLASHRLAA